MKKIKIGKTLMMIWFITYIVYNTYFGWNKEPMSEIEKNFDTASSILLWIGVLVYFNPIYKLYEDAVSKMESK